MTRNFEWAKIDRIRNARGDARADRRAGAANLAAAVMGIPAVRRSAEDLRRRAGGLQDQLAAAQAHVVITRKLVEKVEGARRDGDQFLART